MRLKEKIISIFEKYSSNTFLHICILFFVVIITFSPVLKMFFYSDDFGDLYVMKHNIPPTASYYSRFLVQFLYHLFGLNPLGYYAIGLGVIFLYVLLLYLFSKDLFNSSKLGLLTGIFGAITPIGIATIFMVTTFYTESGYQVNVMLLALLYVFLQFFRRKKTRYYLLTVAMLFLFLIVQQKRGFLFIPILFLFDYFQTFKKIIPSWSLIKRQIPFVLIFIYSYTQILPINQILHGHILSSRNIDTTAKLIALGHSLFDIQPFVSLANVIASIPVIFLPGNTLDMDSLFVRNVFLTIIAIITISFVFLAFKIKKKLGLLLLFAIGWIYADIIGFYVFSSPGISETTSRTLTQAGTGYALLITIISIVSYLFLKTKKIFSKNTLKYIFVIVGILFFGITIFASRQFLVNFNNTRSKYAFSFYKDIKVLFPKFSAGSVIYVETSKDPQMHSRLYNITKGNPYGVGGTLGLFYNLDYKQLTFFDDINDFKKYINSNQVNTDTIYGIYYSSSGISDITKRIRFSLNTNNP